MGDEAVLCATGSFQPQSQGLVLSPLRGTSLGNAASDNRMREKSRNKRRATAACVSADENARIKHAVGYRAAVGADVEIAARRPVAPCRAFRHGQIRYEGVGMIENEDTPVKDIQASTTKPGKSEYYDLLGRRLTVPRGLCIERRPDGSTRKVIL